MNNSLIKGENNKMNEKSRISNIKIEGGRLIFKNFQGKENLPYNKEGDRNVGVLLDDELAEQLKADGWHVKYRPPRQDDGYEQPWLSVKVKYGMYPPTIVLINSNGKIRLTEETVGQLDWTQIQKADMIIRPYEYPAMLDKNGKEIRPAGIAAYIKSLYVTVQEDDLAAKYADIPDLMPTAGEVEEVPFN